MQHAPALHRFEPIASRSQPQENDSHMSEKNDEVYAHSYSDESSEYKENGSDLGEMGGIKRKTKQKMKTPYQYMRLNKAILESKRISWRQVE